MCLGEVNLARVDSSVTMLERGENFLHAKAETCRESEVEMDDCSVCNCVGYDESTFVLRIELMQKNRVIVLEGLNLKTLEGAIPSAKLSDKRRQAKLILMRPPETTRD